MYDVHASVPLQHQKINRTGEIQVTAKIIAFSNHKGGAGKTLGSMTLAGFLAKNHSVLVVDADELQTATKWAAQADDAKPFPAAVVGLSAAGGKIHRELQRLSEQYDFIIVDCPPSVTSPIPQSVLLVSDLVIIPTRPSLADIWGVKDTLGLVERAKVLNENLNVVFLVNALTPRTQLGKDSLEVLQTMDGHLLKTVFRQRQAYAQSLVLGGTVFDVPGAKDAQQEVTAMGNEVLELLGLQGE